jgi:hypothetical protein
MLDAVRSVIALAWKSQDGPLVAFIDLGLLYLYTGLFGILCSLLFFWVFKATESRVYAWIGTLIWMIHPSPLSLSSFLDGTFLSSIFITWMVFEIWLISKKEGSISRIVIAATFCFLTRAHFQWFFVPVLGTALYLVGVDRKRLMQGIGIFGLVVAVYCMKQFVLFGSVYSFGWYGTQLAGSMWIEQIGERTNAEYKELCGGTKIDDKAECKNYLRKLFPDANLELNLGYPVAARAVSGKYNTEDRWWISHIKTRITKEQCSKNIHSCITSLWRSVRQNYPEYWVEGWDRQNPMFSPEGGVPWENFAGRLTYKYPWLIATALLVVVVVEVSRRNWVRFWPLIGLSLVPLYVFGITLMGNNYDAFEGGRLKFLLEPTIYIFIYVQFVLALKFIYSRFRKLNIKQDV